MNTHDLVRELREANSSKIVLLVADGLGGLPLTPGGKTELETARSPNLDACAATGEVIVVPVGLLEPDGPIGFALARLHRLVYGSEEPGARFPAPPGFRWSAQWVRSPHGRCLLLRGTRTD